MAGAVTRLGDMSAGACGKPPIPAVSSNARNVLVNGKPPINIGSFWGYHCDDDDCHSEIAVSGCNLVLVNGQPIVTVSSVLSFGDIVAQGSPNVFAYE